MVMGWPTCQSVSTLAPMNKTEGWATMVFHTWRGEAAMVVSTSTAGVATAWVLTQRNTGTSCRSAGFQVPCTTGTAFLSRRPGNRLRPLRQDPGGHSTTQACLYLSVVQPRASLAEDQRAATADDQRAANAAQLSLGFGVLTASPASTAVARAMSDQAKAISQPTMVHPARVLMMAMGIQSRV